MLRSSPATKSASPTFAPSSRRSPASGPGWTCGSVNRLRLGDVTIDRLVELEGPGYDANFFFPDSIPEAWDAEMSWLAPHFYDLKAKTYVRAIQGFLVRTPRHTVLIDACVG